MRGGMTPVRCRVIDFGVFSCEGQSEGAYDRGEDISALMCNG